LYWVIFVAVLGLHVSDAVPVVVGALNVSVTGMTCGLFVAPDAVTVIDVL
jgi:hypothetical protein